jgi:hypothetical protein
MKNGNNFKLERSDLTAELETWFIIKLPSGQCTILPREQLEAQADGDMKKWGPFASRADAIAHRVGLIRAGKCQPS